MTAKHFVFTPDGKRHTRQSKTRVYSHVIVISPPLAGPLGADAREREAYEHKNIARYRKVIEACQRGDEFKRTEDRLSATYSHVKYFIAGVEVTTWARDFDNGSALKPDAHAVVADRFAEFEASSARHAAEYAETAAEYEAQAPDTQIGDWQVVGWSSRADLSASRARGTYLNDYARKHGQDIRILEAQIEAPKVRA